MYLFIAHCLSHLSIVLILFLMAIIHLVENQLLVILFPIHQ